MVAPVVSASFRTAVPLIIAIVLGILQPVLCEDIVVQQVFPAVHQVGAGKPVIANEVISDVALFRHAHPKAVFAVLDQAIVLYADTFAGLQEDSLAVARRLAGPDFSSRELLEVDAIPAVAARVIGKETATIAAGERYAPLVRIGRIVQERAVMGGDEPHPVLLALAEAAIQQPA
jgi:hypothetical protein